MTIDLLACVQGVNNYIIKLLLFADELKLFLCKYIVNGIEA